MTAAPTPGMAPMSTPKSDCRIMIFQRLKPYCAPRNTSRVDMLASGGATAVRRMVRSSISGSANSPSVVAGAAGIASLKDKGLVDRAITTNAESKEIVHQTLDELGLDYLPTNTNFIMHRIKGDLGEYRNRMAEEGLLVGRDFPPMLDYNRLSFGLPNEMDRWAEAIKGFRKNGWI